MQKHLRERFQAAKAASDVTDAVSNWKANQEANNSRGCAGAAEDGRAAVATGKSSI
jgi:hypothetical protein